MKTRFHSSTVIVGVAWALVLGSSAASVDFQRDVRPVLAGHCFSCHGLDAAQRKAKLRLDTAEGATAKRSGPAAVVPGKPDESELIRRILSEDPQEQMPPPEARRPLTPAQREVLRRWVSEGAVYDRHWAFRPLSRPAIPVLATQGWVRHPLDAFVLARLEAEGVKPGPEAQPETWLRRASFDLIGLAPSPRETDAFLADVGRRGDAAYEAAVDRLLASPRYGERQAQEWLDVARFADTHGFNNDTTRTMWRWRDWVIEAFNRNLPYDRFLTEQLAGDLLPGATLDQRIATGFCRNHVVNSEGGIIDEEYRVEYVADRVRTLGMAWMGLTLECGRCHDHKYDPVSQRDYYRLFAFFNSVAEVGEDGRIGNAAPLLLAPTREQQAQLKALTSEIECCDGELARSSVPDAGELERGLATWAAGPLVPAPADPAFALSFASQPAGSAHRHLDAVFAPHGTTQRVTALKPSLFSGAQPWTLTSWVRWEGGEGPILSTMDMQTDPSAGGHGRGAEVRVTADGAVELRIAEFWPAYSIRMTSVERLGPNRWSHVAVTYDGSTKAAGGRIYVDGRACDVVLVRDGLTGKSGASQGPFLGANGSADPERFRGQLGGLRVYSVALSPEALADWVEDRAARWAAAEVTFREERQDWMVDLARRKTRVDFERRWAERERLRRERQAVWRGSPQTMVMAELPYPRTTYVLKRGHYAARAEEVGPGVPEAFGVEWPVGVPTNRLGLATWLTRPEHPLTSRVVVNRFWAQFFGTGLVKTVEDFGLQGELPSHPALLDRLARDFVEQGWDVKRLLRGWVLSATYRQDSSVSRGLWERDPANRWLGRGPRVRLPAEVIRDHALEVAGLLRHRLGGPSVFPVQPSALYQGVVVAADYPGTRWVPSEGEDRFRRSLYTFWKRTVPHPVMTTFDAPDREVCVARRLPTNTPLQALALLNEPGFVEAGAALGDRALREGGRTDPERLSYLFRLGTGRTPEAAELVSLTRSLTALRSAPSGEGRLPDERVVWSSLGSLVLNLDETITKN